MYQIVTLVADGVVFESQEIEFNFRDLEFSNGVDGKISHADQPSTVKWKNPGIPSIAIGGEVQLIKNGIEIFKGLVNGFRNPPRLESGCLIFDIMRGGRW